MQQPSSTSLKFTNNNNSNNSFHKPSKKNHNFSNSHFNNSKNEYEIKNLKNKTNSGYSIPLSKISAYFSSTISKSSLISSNDKKIQIMKNLSTTSKSYNLNKININAQSSYQHSGELQIFNKSILQNMDESDTDENDELDELLFECRYERMIKMLKSMFVKNILNCFIILILFMSNRFQNELKLS